MADDAVVWVSLGVAVGGLLAAAGSLYYQGRQTRLQTEQMKKGQEWDRRVSTFEYAKIWITADIVTLRKSLAPILISGGNEPMDLAAWKAKPTWTTTEVELRAYAAFLEQVCLAAHEALLNEELAYHLYGKIVVGSYIRLEPFVEYTRATFDPVRGSKYQTLQFFETMAKRWQLRMRHELAAASLASGA